jgi:hypothetical protein
MSLEMAIPNRLGRKRKSGRRKPSGDLVVDRLSPQAIAVMMPHRKNLPESHDQRGESVLGRMSMTKDEHGVYFITMPQFLAGQAWASIMGSYLATIGPPHALAGTGRGYDCPGTCKGDCECYRRRQRHAAAYKAVIADAGHVGMNALNRVVIEDKPVSFYGRRALVYALTALARHLGIDNRSRKGMVGN